MKGRRVAVTAGAAVVVVLAAAGWAARASIEFWWRFESLGRNEQGCFEYRDRETGIVLVRVLAGEFTMGIPKHEQRSGAHSARWPASARISARSPC